MSEANKRNLVYFEQPSMRSLYDAMDDWQQANEKRLLSVSIQKDGENFCCVALTNPTEVVITDSSGRSFAGVSWLGRLEVSSVVG